MARVVQRRSTPPYLLIVFVFLFLVATVVAVMMYLDKDKLTQEVAAMKTADAQLYSNQEERTRALGEKAAAGATKDSLIKFYQDQITLLSEVITPATNSIDANAPIRTYVRNKFPGIAKFQAQTNKGVFAYIDELTSTDKTKDGQIDTLKDERDAAKTEAENYAKAIQGINEKLKTNKAEIDAKNAEIADKVAEIKKMNEASWTKTAEDNQKLLDQMKTDMESLKKEHVKLGAAKTKAEAQYTTLLADVARHKPKLNLDLMSKQPDGKILRVVDSKTVYVNLGKNEKVLPGMSFSVYPAGETIDDNKIKGTLEVLHVGDTTTECRITNKYGQSPIAADDIIGNQAFARNQVFTFVVKGIFDMAGTGKANAEGAAQVKEMITHSGGKLEDRVNVGTDFVVIGDAPVVPTKPAEDAPESALEVYEQQMKVLQDYQAASDEARKDGIQILNLNRFLLLMGYQPGKIDLPKMQGN